MNAPQGGVAGGEPAGGVAVGGMNAPQGGAGGAEAPANPARQACVAQCEATPPLDQAGCILEAIRTDQKCGGVAECLDVAAPVVGRKRTALHKHNATGSSTPIFVI